MSSAWLVEVAVEPERQMRSAAERLECEGAAGVRVSITELRTRQMCRT